MVAQLQDSISLSAGLSTSYHLGSSIEKLDELFLGVLWQFGRFGRVISRRSVRNHPVRELARITRCNPIGYNECCVSSVDAARR